MESAKMQAKLSKSAKFQILKPIGIDWKEAGEILRSVQLASVQAMNYAITELYKNELDKFKFKQQTGEHPEKEPVCLQTKNARLVRENLNNISSTIVDQVSQDVFGKFNNEKTDVIWRKTKSLTSFKRTYPLSIRARGVKLSFDEDYFVELNLFSKELEKRWFKFMLYTPKSNSQKAIINRLISDEYKLGACRVYYDEKCNKWTLIVTYTFESEFAQPDKNIRVGVDLGIACPVYCALNTGFQRLGTHGENHKIFKFHKFIERMRTQVQNNGSRFYEHRKGHGRKRKLEPVNRYQNKVKGFRKDINHHLSKAVINFAKENNAGVIVLENLSSLSQAKQGNSYLKTWPIFELQGFIEYKAKENGIEVIKINPRYTSQRCSECGNIDKENREDQKTFVCKSCGKEFNADYNAARNIATDKIEEIISNALK